MLTGNIIEPGEEARTLRDSVQVEPFFAGLPAQCAIQLVERVDFPFFPLAFRTYVHC
jgi:hypothetical protein